MTTTSTHAPASRPPAPGGPPAHAGPASSSLLNPSIDPIRLFKQYWKWLALTGVVGVGLGIGLWYALIRFAPKYTSEAVLEASATIREASDLGGDTESERGSQEMERFMYSQVRDLLSQNTLGEAANDPAVRNDTEWAKRFVENGQYNVNRARRALERSVAFARVVPDTTYIVVTATTGRKQDSQVIANAIVRTFLNQVQQASSQRFSDTLEGLNRRLTTVDTDRRALEQRMVRLLGDNNVETVDRELSSVANEIKALGPYTVDLKNQIERRRTQLGNYEQSLTAPGGVSYPDFLRSEIARNVTIQTHDQNIAALKTTLQSMRSRFGPNHAELRALDARVQAAEAQRTVDEQRLLAESFNSLIEVTRQEIAGLEAELRKSEEQMQSAVLRSTDLTKLIEEYERLKDDAARKAEERERLQAEIGEARAIIDRPTARRVTLRQSATAPDLPSFPPSLKIFVPLVAMLTVGLVAGLILLREALEQRVRAPADVAIIPRMRVVGVIPDLGEDPSKPPSADTAVYDRPHGAIAEQFRQTRSNILKSANVEGKKTVLVTAGLPGSGATMVVANMGHLIACLDRRVLLIDANLRRPRLHQVFQMSEGPGLGEALAGSATLESAARPSAARPNLHVLTAGAKASRVYERLNSEAMTRLLEEAKASYDVVILDSPPMTVAGDALVLANRCDAAALVVRAMSETRGLIARVRNQLGESRAEFMGVVVNGVKSSAGGYFRRNFRLTHEYHGEASAPAA